jgi:hypothetical protein
MTEVARRYGTLTVLGVEVVAVPPRASPKAIAELGSSPPVLFAVVTDGNEEIVTAYRKSLMTSSVPRRLPEQSV